MAGKYFLDIELRGLNKLLSKFQGMENKLKKQILKKVVSAGANPIIKEARSLVPVKTGTLKKSIGKTIKMSKKGTAYARIGPRQGFGYVDDKGNFQDPERYGIPVEFGTDPFLRPAYEESKDEAIRVITEKMKQEIDKI